MQIERASIGRNIGALLSSQVVTWTLATILSVVQPRFLGPSAQGELRLAFSLWTIASVFIGVGTALYLTLEVARNRTAGLTLLGPVLVIRTLAFGVTSLILAAYVVATDAGGDFGIIMALYGVMIFLASLNDAFSAVFVGLERMSTLAKAGIVSRIVGTVAAVSVLVAGGGAASVVIVGAGANLLSLGIMVRALRPIAKLTFGGWRRKVRGILRASVVFLFAGAILTIYQQIDTVVMSVFVDREALGWYGTADTLFGSLLFLPTIVMGSIFPVLGRLHIDDPGAIPPLIRRTASMLLLATVPIGLGTAVVAGPIAPLLYGNAFKETGAVLAVMGPVIIMTAGNVLFGSLSLATGRQRFWSSFMALAIVLTIPIDVVLVPWTDRAYSNGAIGGAIAYMITESLLVVVGLSRVAPFLIERVFVWRATRILLAGGLMFAASWPLRNQMLLVPILVAMVVYGVALIALRVLDEDDRAFVGNVVGRIGIRAPWRQRSIER